MSEEVEEVETAAKEPKSVSEDLVMSSIALVGDVTEESSNDIIFALLMLSEKNSNEYLRTLMEMSEEQIEDIGIESLKPNIDFYISTNGGSADEMFAIYDIIRHIKESGTCTVSTCGIGKVMSAGVLLLASGTKGKRRVGKHCRIMIHSVIGGSTGPMHQLENEFSEVKKIQDAYIQTLVAESNMTEEYLRDLLKKKINVYLSAEEAVELGIADEVF